MLQVGGTAAAAAEEDEDPYDRRVNKTEIIPQQMSSQD
jgi:hypothetical protein